MRGHTAASLHRPSLAGAERAGAGRPAGSASPGRPARGGAVRTSGPALTIAGRTPQLRWPAHAARAVLYVRHRRHYVWLYFRIRGSRAVVIWPRSKDLSFQAILPTTKKAKRSSILVVFA